MNKITDNFCGYLNVGDDTFAYNVSNNLVTLLPAQVEIVKRYEAIDRIKARDITSSEYLFGVADNNCKIAMLCNGKFSVDSLGFNPSIMFRTPIIIKATSNSAYSYNKFTEDWDKFHSITFCGGNINAICNPIMAVKRPTVEEYKKMNSDGAREIKIRPWDDYSRTVDLEIDGEKVILTISVIQAGDANNSEKMEAYSLGELNSFIRFSFENAKGFNEISKYYKLVKSLIAILTMRNNIFFEVYLSQRNLENQYFKTGVCKVFNHYENYSTRKSHNVLHIYNILDCIPVLIDRIRNNEVESLLALLPEDNRKINKISITNVQDLCTALEVAYDWTKKSKEKDDLITELKKNIKRMIAEFTETHEEIDIYKETTISSAFQYLDYTLKQKILTMYNENCDVVDAIISKWSLPQVDEDSVGSFVKLRNSKTHSGIIEWDNSANLYTALLALVYACLFRVIGLSNKDIKSALLQLF